MAVQKHMSKIALSISKRVVRSLLDTRPSYCDLRSDKM